MGSKHDRTQPLKIEWHPKNVSLPSVDPEEVRGMLLALAHCEALLVQSGKDSALPHFLAIVKEIERLYGFTFELVDEYEPAVSE